ncbi:MULTISPECIES: heme biosynthesis HemY N-terminal domain-containing protein [Methylobacillus]|uniref:HemY-like protein n=1 Tax=Methylobacillus flagellatus (strain ATCC 51484 / DSM 6875 / VKM B-1610 / KT) TaxID=265072 RepID=Q1GX93_METFK|nr:MULTISPECIES: heme biosynthesis HemY N-terminal domain-containing protein [Methylobacillus]ABE48303.1 HemY-like protein [Methylobacillus flagellatus KT]MPS47402.1 heme biosynthesis protein HemY [Methylobacillus sp.]
MRVLIWILFILALAIGVSLLAGNNEGYVLIVRPPYRLELSLNLLLILIVLAFVSLHLLLRFIHYARDLPANVRAYKENRRIRLGHAALLEALHAMSQGRYQLALKAASKALDYGEDPSLTALLAARASHKLKQKGQRDYYLAEAERLAPEAAVARLLMQAELLLDDRLYSQALDVLHKIEKIEPRFVPAMRLELKVQLRLNNWEQVLTLLQQLEKHDGMESWQVREIRHQAHQHLIARYSKDLNALMAYWKKVPEDDKLNTRIANIMAEALIKLNAGNQAQEVIEMSLTKTWDSELAGKLGDCASTNPHKQLQQAEHWLLSHEQDAQLLLSLGKMCVRLGLWGKAQSYLEASISVQASAAAHLALAHLLESRGETDAANHHYRLSVQFCRDEK